METTDIIKDLIAENRLEEAIELLNRRIEQNEKDDEAYYFLERKETGNKRLFTI